MKRTGFSRAAILGFFGLWVLPVFGKDAPRPNLVLIYTDDHGYGDVSTYQDTDVRTPHIDRIAAEGMLFYNMRANATVCSPSRAALLTGMHQDRAGVPGVIRSFPESTWGYFNPSVPTLADELNEVGYHTALIGKWHLGLESPNTPNERGFDFFHGFLGDMMNDYFTHRRHGKNYMRRNGETIDPEGHATDVFSDWAADYLRERSESPDEPFFLLLSYNAPHFPIQPPSDWLEKVRAREPEMDRARARNVAFVEHLDAGIGRVLESLESAGLKDDTLVVFTSDNGGSLRHAQNNDPWRDGKQSHYDGGLRVPFMASWPGRIDAGSESDYAGLVFDLFPTFLELAGRTPEKPERLDAVSLVSAFEGNAPEGPRDLYFVRREGNREFNGKSYEALIRGKWKLLRNDPWSPYELYDLERDPGERENLVGQFPEVRNELADALRVQIQRGGRVPWQPPAE